MSSHFANLSEAVVNEARATDSAIAKIERHDRVISFDWFRAKLRRDHNLKDELGYGTAILPSPAHLDQYLHTYGLMIQSQWENVCES